MDDQKTETKSCEWRANDAAYEVKIYRSRASAILFSYEVFENGELKFDGFGQDDETEDQICERVQGIVRHGDWGVVPA